MPDRDYQKEAINHFRLSIIDAKLAYTLFKSLYLSRAKNTVDKKLFEKYFWVQKQHNYFFKMVEHCAVNTFVIKIMHGFDGDSRSLSLKDICEDSYKEFIEKNKKVIEGVKNLRNKKFAHYDKSVIGEKETKLPPFEEIDLFFKNLEKFYNKLSSKYDDSTTIFKQDEDLKSNLEKVLQNLYVGEKIRLLNIEMKWQWNENPKKISKIQL